MKIFLLFRIIYPKININVVKTICLCNNLLTWIREITDFPQQKFQELLRAEINFEGSSTKQTKIYFQFKNSKFSSQSTLSSPQRKVVWSKILEFQISKFICHILLKLVFTIFFQIFIFTQNDSPLTTMKNVFISSLPLLILQFQPELYRLITLFVLHFFLLLLRIAIMGVYSERV